VNLYLSEPSQYRHPDFAPIYAANLELLPPTLIITAEHDTITEQAEAYGGLLAERGVAVSLMRHAGMIHGFLTMDVFFSGPAGRAMRQIGDFIDRLIE
jgi:acetyl esterase